MAIESRRETLSQLLFEKEAEMQTNTLLFLGFALEFVFLTSGVAQTQNCVDPKAIACSMDSAVGDPTKYEDFATDLTYREIARVLNISEANVKVRVHRSRMKLKAILSSGGK